MTKVLKSLMMLLSVLFLVVILFLLFHLYKAFKSGDIKSYFINYTAELFIDKSKLSPTQTQYLESGDYENLAKDIGENVTQTQIDCAVEALGEERANEILVKNDPTPQELLKLSKCL